MKAIIMAGGEGSRLRPLTCTMPKPMARIFGRPVMEHIILLLRKHGITEIGVTLMYMPEKIREYFGDGAEWGVHLTYFLEETPLGTAGSVKNAAEFLSDDFLVISGDAITDADLSAFLAFHKEKGAEASLLLKPMDVPLEYGVVVTDKEGRITRFLEKPSWSRVLSDTVNTGIYLLKPSVLSLCNKFPCDFSKDIFPRLLEEERKLFGFVTDAYWCDIGDLDAYRHCHYDIFAEKLAFDMGACRLSDGVYAEEGVIIESGAKITPPVFLGRGAHIKSGAKIDAFTTVGEGTVIESGASLKRSVLYDHVTVGKNAEVRGSILLSRSYLGENTALFEQSVLGEESRVGDDTVVKPGVKIWPGKVIGKGEIISSNLVWGSAQKSDLFSPRGLSGFLGAVLTPRDAQNLGGAAGATLGKRIGIASDGKNESRMLKKAAESGLMGAGCKVFDFGDVTLPITRSAVKVYGLDGAIFTSFSDGKGGVEVVTKGGLSLDESLARKLETVFFREDFHMGDTIFPVEENYEYKRLYLKRILARAEKCGGLSFAAATTQSSGKELLTAAAAFMGCALFLDNTDISEEDTEGLSRFAASVTKRGCAFGAVIDPALEKITLIDERGRVLKREVYETFAALLILRQYENAKIYAPVSAPDAIDALALKYGGTVIRTRENPAAFMQGVSGGDRACEAQFILHFDALGAILCILSFLSREKKSLSAILEEIPKFSVERRSIGCEGKDKGKIIRSLLERTPSADSTDGVKIYEKNGWVLILPEAAKPACRIIAHAQNEEYARELTDIYDAKIREILDSE